MAEVIASILSPGYTYDQMKEKIGRLRGLVSTVQIDICDGVFTSSKTWPFISGGIDDPHFSKIIKEEEGLPYWQDFDFELDLMVKDAVENFDLYLKLGSKAIIFHLEAMENLKEFRDFLEGIDMYVRDVTQIGIAFKPGMSLQNVFPLVPFVDFIQLMGNDKIGYPGVMLDKDVYEKLKELRKKYPDLPLEVDIGVNKETAPLLVEAGATKLVTGSALFNSGDIIEAVEYFKSL